MNWNLAGFGTSNAPTVVNARVTLIGAVNSGKTILTVALKCRAPNVKHSFGRRIAVNASEFTADNDVADIDVSEALELGLNVKANYPVIDIDKVDEAIGKGSMKMSCLVSARSASVFGGGAQSDAMSLEGDVDIRDCQGALLSPQAGPDDAAAAKVRLEAAVDSCAKSQAMILCLPVGGDYAMRRQNQSNVHAFLIELQNRLAKGERKLEKLILCLTKFESLGWLDRPGRATGVAERRFHAATAQAEGRARILNWFSVEAGATKAALASFVDRTGVSLWAVPVSAFGFIPQDGAPNRLRHFANGRAEELLRLSPAGFRAAQACLQLGDADFPTYTSEQAFADWQPYRVLDPFLISILPQELLIELVDDEPSTLILSKDDLFD